MPRDAACLAPDIEQTGRGIVRGARRACRPGPLAPPSSLPPLFCRLFVFSLAEKEKAKREKKKEKKKRAAVLFPAVCHLLANACRPCPIEQLFCSIIMIISSART